MKNNDISGRRLLVLGATMASADLVKNAKEMGVVTAVTDDDPTHPVRAFSDEDYLVSTTDIDGLAQLIKDKNFDGVFCGPSEFNIRNLIKLTEKTGLPCYTNSQQWEACANKDVFTHFCMEYGVDCPKEFDVNENSGEEALAQVDYPVIVKPVDRCSSIGISVANNPGELRESCRLARKESNNGRIIVEKYIENSGELFGVRYFLRDGEATPYLLIDTYVADPVKRISLISAVTLAPSKHIDYYMKNMDADVRAMLKGMGLKNGTVFIQALPYNGRIYFHEMGFRLSGGFIYKMTTPLMHINDMKMMIRFALGGDICTDEDYENIDVFCGGRAGGQLMIPLSAGKIGRIEGLSEARQNKNVVDFIQYYREGDTVDKGNIGTLQQLFGRFTLAGDSKDEIVASVNEIQNTLKVYADDGRLMTDMVFDLNRLNY